MQRLTKSLNVFQVSNLRVSYILDKSEKATPELLAIYMQNDESQ